MKDLILELLDLEILEAKYSYNRGQRNINEMYTDSLIIEFVWDTFSYVKDKQMIDIQITDENDVTEAIVYASDLSDEQVIKILQVAQLEEYANDMDVEI